ncbi:deoxyribodipyrimidine photo-lyase [Vibrio sp. WJH972]
MRLIWFRRDLRVEDNKALLNAVENGEPVVAIYLATPKQWAAHHLAPIQADLIFRRLAALQKELAQLNIPLVYEEVDDFSDSVRYLVTFAKRYSISSISINKEYEVNEIRRDQELSELAERYHINVVQFDDKCIQAPGSILNQQGLPYKVYTPFKNAWKKAFFHPHIKKMRPLNVDKSLEKFDKLLFDSSTSPFHYPRQPSDAWPVSHSDVKARLRQFCRSYVNDYNILRDYPSANGGSQLSPYLALGILSPRQCVARLYLESNNGVLSDGAEAWMNELIWREFYQHLLFFRPDISKGSNFHQWADGLTWNVNDEWLARWKSGKTGFPIVDAAMRQLNADGWMPNRLRMVTASFLTKDLHISWREGEAYFMSKLIDGDYAANNGGWQWSASTGCDAQPYFRIFNPVSQGEKFDKQGEYVRFWVPELKNVPDNVIHQPWYWTNASSLSYPSPIVDHKIERETTLMIYKEAKKCEGKLN